MSQTPRSRSRRQQILESLARMLEASPGGRITTAALAEHVGVSEAALYRHFPSKSKMFEGLLEFVEHTLFTRINTIINEHDQLVVQCEKIVSLLLAFSERNPGITRLLTGDALVGETPKLRLRVCQLFDRLETQLKKVIRDASSSEPIKTHVPAPVAAHMLITLTEGRIAQFVRSDFKRLPTEHWPEQWTRIVAILFYSAKADR